MCIVQIELSLRLHAWAAAGVAIFSRSAATCEILSCFLHGCLVLMLLEMIARFTFWLDLTCQYCRCMPASFCLCALYDVWSALDALSAVTFGVPRSSEVKDLSQKLEASNQELSRPLSALVVSHFHGIGLPLFSRSRSNWRRLRHCRFVLRMRCLRCTALLNVLWVPFRSKCLRFTCARMSNSMRPCVVCKSSI